MEQRQKVKVVKCAKISFYWLQIDIIAFTTWKGQGKRESGLGSWSHFNTNGISFLWEKLSLRFRPSVACSPSHLVRCTEKKTNKAYRFIGRVLFNLNQGFYAYACTRQVSKSSHHLTAIYLPNFKLLFSFCVIYCYTHLYYIPLFSFFSLYSQQYTVFLHHGALIKENIKWETRVTLKCQNKENKNVFRLKSRLKMKRSPTSNIRRRTTDDFSS